MVGIRRRRPRPAEDDDYRDPSMLRLTVDEHAWRSHVGTWRDVPGLVPVVKGNGYGFGRATLARVALELGVGEVAVGTAHELADVAAIAAGSRTAVVALTPAVHLPAPLPPGSVLTVGSPAHVRAALVAGHRGPVAVKLESSSCSAASGAMGSRCTRSCSTCHWPPESTPTSTRSPRSTAGSRASTRRCRCR
jgi:hypothetical protein